MNTYRHFIAAAAVLLGLAACSKETETIPEYLSGDELVPVTLGADFSATRTSLDDATGNVLWSANDRIKVQIGENQYSFTLKTGEGTASGTFSAFVKEDDAKVLDGTTTGVTVTAYYPTSGAEVSGTQTYKDGSFADDTFPMTATFADKTLSFTTNAAVVRIQNVSESASSAVLSYTVSDTPYSVSMALTAGSDPKDLYFVIVPGARQFSLKLDDSAAVSYTASETTAAGSRYNLTIPKVAKIGETSYTTLSEAIDAAKTGDTITMINDSSVDGFNGDLYIIPAGKNITLDLNGKTVSATASDSGTHNMFHVINGATFTVKDAAGTGGNITYTYTGAHSGYPQEATVYVNGDFNLVSGTISNLTTDGNSAHFAVDHHPNEWGDTYADLTPTFHMTGGKLYTVGDEALRFADYGKENTSMVPSVIIDGGEIEGWDAIFVQQPNGNYNRLDLTVNDGTLKGAKAAIRVYADDPAKVVGSDPTPINIKLDAGTYTSGKQSVTGGEWLLDDVLYVQNTKTVPYIEFTGKLAPLAVAKIGSTSYETLGDAFSAVKEGEEILLIADANIASTITTSVNASYTLNLNGKTVTSDKEAIQVTKGQLTVIGDGTIDTKGTDGNYSFRVANIGKLVIGAEGKNYALKINDYVVSTTETTIWGGEISKVCCFPSTSGSRSDVTINGGAIKHLDNTGSWSDECPTTIYLNGGIYNSFETIIDDAAPYCKYVCKEGYKIGDNTDAQTKDEYKYTIVAE